MDMIAKIGTGGLRRGKSLRVFFYRDRFSREGGFLCPQIDRLCDPCVRRNLSPRDEDDISIGVRCLPAFPSGAFQHVQSLLDRLAHYRLPFPHDLAGIGVDEMLERRVWFEGYR